MRKNKENTPRSYPLLYEKAVPIMVGVLALILIALLVAAVAIVFGFAG